MDKPLIKRNRIKHRMLYFLLFIFFFSCIPVSSASADNDDILMVIHDREITKAEFKRLWDKHNLYTDPQSLNDYLELYVNFHVKLAHARDEGIHLQNSLQDELAGYRKKLSQTYLRDPDTEKKLAREAYERFLYDINASHILVKLPPGYSPEDSLKAWEKTIEITKRLLEGEDFQKVARATSDDPSAKTNSGNLGYFTVFQMVYPFENAVYLAEPGEISIPVRTRFGYHIIRVNDKLKSRGEIQTAHIMIGFNQYSEQEAKEKIKDIYEDLLDGNNFEHLASEHSTDINTADRGGLLPWFGSGRIVPEFEKAAFSLEQAGDISEPVRTNYGWHIIKLIDHREIPPYDEIKKELLDRIRNSKDERSQIIKDALVERLKKEWGFSENPIALEIFYRLIDESIFYGNWTAPANLQLNQTMFTVTGKSITQKDFADFISKNTPRRKPWPIDEYIHSLYQEFVTRWLINYEERNLENKYPEFRFLMKEYKDGMLLFEINDREVWSRARSDSAGLAEFYQNNLDDYMWGKRISASIFTTEDNRIARRAERRIRRSTWFDRRDDDWIIDRLNRRTEKDVITVEKGVFSRGDDHLIDQIKWTEEISGIIQTDNQYHIVLIHKIIDPEPKTLDKSRGQVVADYQDYLDDKWIKELRDKYNVVINKNVLSEIGQ